MRRLLPQPWPTPRHGHQRRASTTPGLPLCSSGRRGLEHGADPTAAAARHTVSPLRWMLPTGRCAPAPDSAATPLRGDWPNAGSCSPQPDRGSRRVAGPPGCSVQPRPPRRRQRPQHSPPPRRPHPPRSPVRMARPDLIAAHAPPRTRAALGRGPQPLRLLNRIPDRDTGARGRPFAQ